MYRKFSMFECSFLLLLLPFEVEVHQRNQDVPQVLSIYYSMIMGCLMFLYHSVSQIGDRSDISSRKKELDLCVKGIKYIF